MAAHRGIDGEALWRNAFRSRRALLVIAHPGHELRVHHWLEGARPEVHVLTDGGGRSGQSRLPMTERILADAGAWSGTIFGRLTDRDMYAAILERRIAFFESLAEELAERLLDADYVVGDAAEGYNPAHDICRSLIDAAAARAGAMRGRPIARFAFPLIGPPERRRGPAAGTVRLTLGDEAFARKLAAARTSTALDAEVEAAFRAAGRESFRVEALEPVVPEALPLSSSEPPEYECYGEGRVARGLYATVIRQREHVLPIAEALRAMGNR